MVAPHFEDFVDVCELSVRQRQMMDGLESFVRTIVGAVRVSEACQQLLFFVPKREGIPRVRER